MVAPLTAVRAAPVLITPSAPAPTTTLAPGSVLDAVVVARSGQDLTLELGGTRIQARSTLALPSDRAFAVEVRSGGSRPVLEVVDPVVRDQALRAEALRTALPRQVPLERALDAVAASLRGAQPRGPAGPAPVESLLRAIPDASALTRPGVLARAIQDSGLLLEAKLARAARGEAPARVDTDLKALVLRALASLDGRRPAPDAAPRAASALTAASAPPGPSAAASPTPGPPTPGTSTPPAPVPAPVPSPGAGPEARAAQRAPSTAAPGSAAPGTVVASAPQSAERALDGALGRVQALQLASVEPARPDGVHWHLEIPVRDGDRLRTLELVVERDASGSEDEEARWSVDLGVDLGELGRLHGRVTLAAGVVNAALWASEPATTTLVRSRLGALQADLEAAGLEVGTVLVRPGPPPAPAEDGSPGALVHERA